MHSDEHKNVIWKSVLIIKSNLNFIICCLPHSVRHRGFFYNLEKIGFEYIHDKPYSFCCIPTLWRRRPPAWPVEFLWGWLLEMSPGSSTSRYPGQSSRSTGKAKKPALVVQMKLQVKLVSTFSQGPKPKHSYNKWLHRLSDCNGWYTLHTCSTVLCKEKNCTWEKILSNYLAKFNNKCLACDTFSQNLTKFLCSPVATTPPLNL